MKTISEPVVAQFYCCDTCDRRFTSEVECREHEKVCVVASGTRPVYKTGEWVCVRDILPICHIKGSSVSAQGCWQYDVAPLALSKDGIKGVGGSSRWVPELHILSRVDKDYASEICHDALAHMRKEGWWVKEGALVCRVDGTPIVELSMSTPLRKMVDQIVTSPHE